MAMRPLGRDEALQHLFVLAIAAFLIVVPIFIVQPDKLEFGLIAVGALFAAIDLMVVAALRRPRL
ncbi:MAG: hypothetical protein ACRDZX_06065 [Acidimicrobiales bacterium]